MKFGVCYYPEHWKKSEWSEHIRLMKEAGFNTVRMADFAWRLLEPREGEYDFSLFDEAIAQLGAAGIDVILCTPTAAPPKWLVNQYDVLQRNRYGIRENWGSRRECCANNPVYQMKSATIVEKMVQHYKDNPHVAGWQIDNEFGCHDSAKCYCEHCRRAFAGWLEKKYKTIDNLNEKWGNVFWSLTLDSFEDVILPVYNSCEPEDAHSWSHNPSLDLEYRRFSSDSWVNFQQRQLAIIREHTGKPVTHNLMGHNSELDYYKLAKELDFVSWDNYPDNQWGDSEYEYVSMAHEIMRGVKDKNFIVAEEQSGPCGWDVMGATPEPGQLRLWTYQAIAHGAEGMIYFRFRSLPYGMEQYWYGVLDHDGVPRRRYYEILQTGEELQRVENYIVGAENNYQALLVRDYDNIWAHDIKHHTAKFSYTKLLYDYYKANADWNISMAVSKGNYEKYQVVYMPAYNLIDEEEVKKVTEYVKNGGTLVLTFRSGTRDTCNNLYTTTMPGVFRKLAGVEVEEFDGIKKETYVDGIVSSKAEVWCDILKPVSADVLATYSNRYFKGRAAITVNRFGEGWVYYVGCDLEPQAMRKLTAYIAKRAGIKTTLTAKGVELVDRKNCTFLLNHNDYEVELPFYGKSLLTGKDFEGTLEPYGVEMLQK